MAISLSSLKTGKDERPPRILIYGVEGVGKTTFAANAPNPVFIFTEDGQGLLEVTSFPLAKSYSDVMDALGALASEAHDFKTLVIDSLDWLEPLIWAKVCADNKVPSIEKIGYGKGYAEALSLWRELIDAINYLRDAEGMMIILTGHAEIKKFESPDTESYDRYQLKLHKLAGALMQEHVDCVFFANYRLTVAKEETGFNKQRARAVGSGQRVFHTEERPAFAAKNRYSLPDTLPLDKGGAATWDALIENVPYLKKQYGAAETAQAQA